MLITDNNQYNAIWDRVYNELGFKPSCDYRGHSLNVPLPFNTNKNYAVYGFDTTTEEQMDLIPDEIRRIFIEITQEGQKIYALDWHHSCFIYDPRNLDEQTDIRVENPNIPCGYHMAYFPSFLPDGDYYFFIDENFSFGYLGHPWREEIWVFGDDLIDKIDEIYEKLGFSLIKGKQDECLGRDVT